MGLKRNKQVYVKVERYMRRQTADRQNAPFTVSTEK